MQLDFDSLEWSFASGRRRKEKKGLNHKRLMRPLQNVWDKTELLI
jgi:hypothetical protein